MERSASHTVLPEVAAFLRGGVAIVVATRDDELRPDITRGWGPDVADDGATVTLCVAAPPGSRTRANLEGNGAIATTFSLPTTYRGVQLKGLVLELDDPTPEQLARVEDHVASFVSETDQLGLPAGRGRELVEPGLLAVKFAVHAVFDQTPGARAGSQL